MKNQFNDDQRASITAKWTNICRAMARKEKHPKFQGPDDMAKLFISPIKNSLLSLVALKETQPF